MMDLPGILKYMLLIRQDLYSISYKNNNNIFPDFCLIHYDRVERQPFLIEDPKYSQK